MKMNKSSKIHLQILKSNSTYKNICYTSTLNFINKTRKRLDDRLPSLKFIRRGETKSENFNCVANSINRDDKKFSVSLSEKQNGQIFLNANSNGVHNIHVVINNERVPVRVERFIKSFNKNKINFLVSKQHNHSNTYVESSKKKILSKI